MRDHPKRFRLTDAHVNLLSEMLVDWDDSGAGAPCINPFSPYGSGVDPGRVLRLAGVNPQTSSSSCSDGSHRISFASRDLSFARQLHGETAIALQIVLSTKSFAPGMYRQVGSTGRRWEREY